MPDVPFSDFGLKWFEDIVGKVTDWFSEEIVAGYRGISNELFKTPVPDGSGPEVVFGAPASGNEPWHSIYQSVVGGEIMLLALLILFLTVQGRHFVRIFNIGNAYSDRYARRNAWTGAILIVGWYWVGVLILYFVKGLTIGIIPDISEVGSVLIDLLPAAAGNPMLTLMLAALGGVAMVLLKAVYFIRDILLFVYLYGMPIGIAIVYGNVPVLSRIAKRLCLQFLPLAILPLPAAVLFRGYALLFGGDQMVTPTDAFLSYFVVVSLPVLALYVTWKTFRYASPLVSGAIGTASKTAASLGVVAGLGYGVGPRAAASAARWGPKAGLSHAAVNRFTSDDSSGTASRNSTSHDNIASDATGGVPAYRRSENDPGYY